MSETHGSIETRRPKGLPPVCLPPPCPRGRYDVGSFASTGFDPQESFRSMKAAWPSAAIALGVMVGRGRGGAGASPGLLLYLAPRTKGGATQPWPLPPL